MINIDSSSSLTDDLIAKFNSLFALKLLGGRQEYYFSSEAKPNGSILF